MSCKPLVSCIINFFNTERFIEEAIESVFDQTYDNWELLLVDDGSNDGSSVIALQYAQKYPGKVSYLEHEGHQNRGVSAARNLGIRNAQGEYIAFLDADDIWLPQKLERQVEILDSKPEAAVVFGPTQFWYSWTGNRLDRDLDSIRDVVPQYNRLFEPPILFTLLLQNKARAPIPSSALMRRTLFELTGGFEESFRGMFEDLAFFSKVYLKAPVFITSEFWDRYRQHPDSCCSIAEKTGQYSPGHLSSAYLAFLKWLSEYLEQQGVKNAEIWSALQKALWSYEHPFLYYLSRPTHLLRLIGRKLLPEKVREWLWVKYQALARTRSKQTNQT